MKKIEKLSNAMALKMIQTCPVCSKRLAVPKEQVVKAIQDHILKSHGDSELAGYVRRGRAKEPTPKPNQGGKDER